MAVLAVVLLAIVLGIGGWYVFDRNQAETLPAANLNDNGSTLGNESENSNLNQNTNTNQETPTPKDIVSVLTPEEISERAEYDFRLSSDNVNLGKTGMYWKEGEGFTREKNLSIQTLNNPLFPQEGSYEMIKNIRCNTTYCLIVISGPEDQPRLLRYEAGKIIDLPKLTQILDQRTRAPLSYEWNGEYWLIGRQDKILKYDGKDIISVSGLSKNDVLQSIAWNGHSWGISFIQGRDSNRSGYFFTLNSRFSCRDTKHSHFFYRLWSPNKRVVLE